MNLKNKGFTLIELLVVIAIMGIMAAVVSPHIISMIERQNKISTYAEMSEVKQALLDYYTDNSVMPATTIGADSGLVALIWNAESLGTWKGPYISSSNGKLINDEFKNPYIYSSTNADGNKAVLISAGKDRVSLAANYDNFDFSIVKDAATTGFPWDAASDDLISNIVGKGSTPVGGNVSQTLTDVISALVTCGDTGAYAGFTCVGNNDLYCNQPNQIAATFTDPWSNPILQVSCAIARNDSNYEPYSYVYSTGGVNPGNPDISVSTGNAQDICKDIKKGDPLGTKGGKASPGPSAYAPNVITIINNIPNLNSSDIIKFEQCPVP